MATPPNSRTQRLLEADTRAKFQTLARQWEADTGHLSSVTKMAEHPACQQIIAMGKDVVPLVLDELAAGRNPGWFWVRDAVTGADPVPEADRGRIEKMAEHWLAWGRERAKKGLEYAR